VVDQQQAAVGMTEVKLQLATRLYGTWYECIANPAK